MGAQPGYASRRWGLIMAKWNLKNKVRLDDPYHCWAYHRTQGPRSDGDVDNPEIELVPIVVEIKVDDDRSLKSLLANLTLLEKELDDESLGMPPYDQEHLRITKARIEKIVEEEDAADVPDEDRTVVGPELDYARIFLIYATETAVVNDDGPQRGFQSFSILYSGRALPNLFAKSAGRVDQPAVATKPSSVLVIVDDSLAFLNEEFTSKQEIDGKIVRRTIFNEIWFQDKPYSIGGSFFNGFRLSGDDIDRLRNKPDLTEAEKYAQPVESTVSEGSFQPVDPTSEGSQPLTHSTSHGTHVASTALRAFYRNSFNLDLKLFGITLPVKITEDTSGSTLDSYLITALRQAMLWGDMYYPESAEVEQENQVDVPLVINFSYGFSAGPKDGTSRLNKVIKRMIESRNARGRQTYLVVPMGNSYNSSGNAKIEMGPDQSRKLTWVLPPDDRTSSFLELFSRPKGGAEAEFAISLEAPEDIEPNRMVDSFPPKTFDSKQSSRDKIHLLSEENIAPIAGWSLWATETGSYWSHRGFVAIAPTEGDNSQELATSGRYSLTFTNTSQNRIELWALVQRDDTPGNYVPLGRQSYLENGDPLNTDSPITHERTANVFASIESEFVVAVSAGTGEYLPLPGEAPAPMTRSPYCSVGPRLPGGSRDDQDYMRMADRTYQLPGIYAAGTLSGTEVLLSGTSVAAPQVAGELAAALAPKLPEM